MPGDDKLKKLEDLVNQYLACVKGGTASITDTPSTGGQSGTPAKIDENTKCKTCGVAYKDHFAFDKNGKIEATRVKHPTFQGDFPGMTGIARPDSRSLGETSIANELMESFGYLAELDPGEVAKAGGATLAATNADHTPLTNLALGGAGGWAGGKVASKIAGKAIPGLATGLSWADAYNRWKEGDYLGAGISGLSGATALIPGVGIPLSLGLDAANLGIDYGKGKGFMGFGADEKHGGKPQAGAPTGTTAPTTPSKPTFDPSKMPGIKPGGDPKIYQLQKIIGAQQDGLYGPETKEKLTAWQSKVGIKPDGMPGPQTYGKAGINEHQMLREKLAIMESSAEQDITYVYFDTERNCVWDQSGKAYLDLNEANYAAPVEAGWNALKGLFKSAPKAGEIAADAGKVKPGVNAAADAAAVKPTPPKLSDLPVTTRKATPNNPNIAGQTPYVQGRSGYGQGSAKTQFAKYDPATSAMANAEKNVNNMVRGGVADRAALEKGMQTFDKISDAEKVTAVEKSLANAEKITEPAAKAAALEAKEASRMGKLAEWIKNNPGKAALIAVIAGGLIGYGIGKLTGGDDPVGPVGPPNGPNGPNGPVVPVPPVVDNKPDCDELLKQINVLAGQLMPQFNDPKVKAALQAANAKLKAVNTEIKPIGMSI
jgi:hypothetical protein